jgi:hypothetical protein
MATPTSVQQNVLSSMQATAMQLLDLEKTMAFISQMWTNESMQNLADADIQSLPDFAGVTQVMAMACQVAFAATVTAMGDAGTPGTNSYKMLKMANKVP